MQQLFNHFDDLPEADLVTREIGIKAYEVLRDEVLRSELDGLVIFDFSDVFVMDSSFAGPSVLRIMDELIAGQYDNRYIALTNASESTRENIDLTIRGHGLKLAIPFWDKNAGIAFLGEIEPNLQYTFDVILERKSMTARDLADKEKISIGAASNRLKRLHDLRLIRRVEEVTSEGRRHRYQLLAV